MTGQAQVYAALVRPRQLGQCLELRPAVIALGWHGDATKNALVKRSEAAPIGGDQIGVDVLGI